MKIGQYKQMMNYLTRPKNDGSNIKKDSIEPRRSAFNKKDDTKVTQKNSNNGSNNLAINLAKATALYDDNDELEKTLRKELINKMNSGQTLDSQEVRFMMDSKPRDNIPMATPKQMTEVKKKIDKYKITNGVGKIEDKPANNMNDYYKNKKPFVKKKSAVLSIPQAKIDPTPDALNIAPIRTPEELEQERKFNRLLKEVEDEKNRVRYSGLGALLP